jgi:hypothetical protein
MKFTSKLMAGASAVAFLAGIGGATAQAPQKQEGQPSVQMEQKSGTSLKQEGGAGRVESKQDTDVKAQQGNRQGQTEMKASGKAQTETETKASGKAQTGTETKASGSAETGTKKDGRAQTESKKDGQAQTDAKSGGGDKAANVQLNSEQRTKISQSIKSQNVKRITNVNFNISVGTRVPRNYTFYPLPATVVSFVPAYRGYLYIVVGDDMLIIHPRTYEIVAVIAV